MINEFEKTMEEIKAKHPNHCKQILRNYLEWMDEKRLRHPRLILFEVLNSLREEKVLLFLCLSDVYKTYQHTNFCVRFLTDKDKIWIVDRYYEELEKKVKEVIHATEMDT